MRTLYRVLLICLILPVSLLGCQKAPEGTDPFKTADSATISTAQTEELSERKAVVREDIGNDILQLQEDLEGFSEDIEQFENLGVESAIAEIDRELDGF